MCHVNGEMNVRRWLSSSRSHIHDLQGLVDDTCRCPPDYAAIICVCGRSPDAFALDNRNRSARFRPGNCCEGHIYDFRHFSFGQRHRFLGHQPADERPHKKACAGIHGIQGSPVAYIGRVDAQFFNGLTQGGVPEGLVGRFANASGKSPLISMVAYLPRPPYKE